VLGRYEVGVKVGGGGMADVYVGRETRDDGRDELVALKVIRDEYGHDARYLRMFSDEAKILARLSHPNIIRTLEYGIAKEHRYIAMELLLGQTLAQVWDLLAARGERLSLSLGAWICSRIADALHAAHEMTDDSGNPLGVVHRDVNPSNVFLTYSGEVKLIDFGLAKARVRRTQSVNGIVKGKIPYLAPEQLTMNPIDRRIDLYALGTTLWEMGTMARLFKRETDLETLRAIREAKVPDPRELVPGYPDDLYAVVLLALQSDPDDRYSTASEMRDDLVAFIGDQASESSAELAELVSRLYSGEKEKHLAWRRAAIKVSRLSTVAPPPEPFPTASSKLLSEAPATILDDIDIEIVG
jgi:serine/threonine protein kinase